MTNEAGETPGLVFHWPRAYDLLLRLVWGSREQRYRDRVLQLVGLADGQAVLDVGCGTGTLAISARRIAGFSGCVAAIDASPEMIARAKTKAMNAGAAIDFRQGTAQELPFADASFDVVLSTTVIHCLPETLRAASFEEMARVLKPGGRLLLIDFGGSAESKHSLFGHLHAHRQFDLLSEISRVEGAGFIEIASGPTGFSDLHYILATKSIAHKSMRSAA
ncbi:MAG: class I SAM-dependent methyltransferase [Sphingomicrobium sp.]